MKKIVAILACTLVCFSLFTGCTDQKGGGDQDTNLRNSVELDNADIEIDAEPRPDNVDNSNNATLSDGFTYSFRDPNNADDTAAVGGGENQDFHRLESLCGLPYSFG